MSDPNTNFLAAVGRMAEASGNTPPKAEDMDARDYAAHVLIADRYSPVVEAFLIGYRYKAELQGELSAMEAAKNAAMTLAHEREAEIKRLEGCACLICGASEPCELDKGEMSPCTFDPSPIEAARRFLDRAVKSEAEVARLREERDGFGEVIAYWVRTPGNKRDAAWWVEWDMLIQPYRDLYNAHRAALAQSPGPK